MKTSVARNPSSAIRHLPSGVSILALLTLGGLVPGQVLAQAITTRTLTRPEASFPEPFTAVSGIRELRDGRVIVVDENQRTVQLVDFSSGTTRPIGRKGRGPGEYQLPSMVYALEGDTIAIMDEANRRFLFILPDGKPGKDEWRERQRGGMAIIGDGDHGTYTMVPRPRNRDPEFTWPEFLPPFSAEATRFAPDGSLWVKRTGPARTPPNFDVIDRNGVIVQRVVLPARTRLVGFGANGAIYLVRIDDDDQQFLERYRLN